MSKPIQMIVADDHMVMREGLVALLQDEPDMEVVGQASTGQEAIMLCCQHQPHIALLDITMSDMTGFDVARQCRLELPHMNIIILTMHEEEAFFFEALRAGASGYVLKGAHSDELFSAIRTVYAGGVYLPPSLAGVLVQKYLSFHPQPAPQDPLTPREREVLTLIAQGLSNSRIARQLILSPNTVKTHRLRIYQKLNLNNRAGLVNYALEQGLLHSHPAKITPDQS
ncbi:MAG: Oxygen regulatory protein NreC [Anaerolineae bacterium]|nr:Oxygen regulatory protein NreC [Anaerolineae bacterium]